MTKHLAFLFQQGRRGIHCVFKGERLFRPHERRNFPQRSPVNRGTNAFRFWFPPRWTSFIWRVKVSFASFHWCRRRCSCAWYNWPKFRILRPHGLQTRSENLELPCTKENPTWRTISLKTTPKHSFRFEGLKTFSDEEWLCLGRFPNWILKETLKAYSCHSHSYRTSRTICSRIWRLGSTCVCFLPEVVVKDFKINSFLLVTFLFPEMQWSATNQGAYGILTASSSRRLFSLPPPPPPTVHSNCKSKMAGRTNDPELLTLTLARTNKTPALQAIKIIAFYVVFRGKDFQWILYLTLSDGSIVCTRLFLFRRLFRWIIACRGKAVHHFSA